MYNKSIYRTYMFAIISAFLLAATVKDDAFAQTKSINFNGYGKAVYNASTAGKCIRTWLVAGPFPVSNDSSEPSDAIQEKAFKTDIFQNVEVVTGKPVKPVTVSRKDFKWEFVASQEDIVDLDKIYPGKDFVYAYAMANIVAATPTNLLLAVGSDDGIKIWHNGKLIHDNWIPRGIKKDDDLVPLKLVKGNNQVLIKVQDLRGGWGFIARLLDKSALTDQLNTAAANGNIDKMKMLIKGGADINAANENGISPIVTAKTGGRNNVVQMLLEKGAKDKPVPSSEAILTSYYSSFKNKEMPGLAVLVAKDGKVLYKKGFGYADIKNKILVTPDTKFRIGSVTKQFTAAAILKLQENNLLSVNDPLSKFVPDFPRGDEVTIHHLLTHTSGIHNYTSKDDFEEKVTRAILPDSLINSFKNDPYDFNPGEKMLYNNSGYFLLGHIIGKVSGKPYATYLKETFFDPLQMKNTGVHYGGIKLENEAKGYAKNNNKFDNALNWDMSWAGAAGAIYSTVDDLLKWNQALHGGKVLSEKSMEAALTPAVLKNGEQPSMQYGYGLGFSKYRGENIIGHGGGLHGFITHLAYYPKEKLSVVMFSNTAEPDIDFNPTKVAEAYLWNKMDTQTSYAEASVKPGNLQIFTGRFDLANVGVLTVSTENDKLYAQIMGQPKFEIFPSSEDEFFWKVVEARLKFIKDEKGEMNHATLFQNGQELKATRIPEEHIIDIDPAILDKYTGKYKFNNLVLTLTKENNKLYVQPEGQSKLEMSPVSETNFVVKEVNAKIFFTKEEGGKVTKFKLSMNGTDSEVTRIEP